MDIARRNQLVEKLKSRTFSIGQHPGPTVSREDFFEGNDDLGSIGCNLSEHPGVDRFHRVFKRIRSRGDVQDVMVEVKDLVDEGSWPFTDTVFVLTSMDQNELKKSVAELHPDEVGEFPEAGTPSDLPPLKTGMKVMGVWWD
jgi:hypothetical protein